MVYHESNCDLEVCVCVCVCVCVFGGRVVCSKMVAIRPHTHVGDFSYMAQPKLYFMGAPMVACAPQ